MFYRRRKDMEPFLTMENLNVCFHTNGGTVKAVDDVSLPLHRGEVFGLIGESGSGKSVLGLSLLQLLPNTARMSGKIMYKGKNLLDLSQADMRKIRGGQIGLIPQNPSSSLNPVLRIGRQVEEGARLHRTWSRQEIRTYSVELLERLGFSDARKNLSAYPFQLSGGMKQRILAAIGIAGGPELIIADEPTKGLDAITREKVVELMREIVREAGATLLLITHDLHVARKLCDRIGVMYAGRIVEIGETECLFFEPKHPYTSALIDALPERGMKPIFGMAPSLTDEVGGCHFHPRCQFKDECCQIKPPPSYFLGEQRREVRCYLYGDRGSG